MTTSDADPWAWLQRPGIAQIPADGIQATARNARWATASWSARILMILGALAVIGLIVLALTDISRWWPALIAAAAIAVAMVLLMTGSTVRMQRGRVSMLGREFDADEIARVQPLHFSGSGAGTDAFLFMDGSEQIRGQLWSSSFTHEDLGRLLAPFAGRVSKTEQRSITEARTVRQERPGFTAVPTRPWTIVLAVGLLLAAGLAMVFSFR